MTTALEEVGRGDVRRRHHLIAALFEFAADEAFQGKTNGVALGCPERQAEAHFRRQHEEAHFAAQLAMVARLGFFESLEVVVEFLLRGVGGAIQTLKLRVGGVAAPERARHRQQLEGFDAACRGQMGAPAQIEPVALPVNSDGFSGGNIAQQFELVNVVREQFVGFLAGDFLAHDGKIGVGELAHFGFDGPKVVFGNRGQVDVVVKTVFERRADGEFGFGMQRLHRLGHQVCRGVPVYFAAFGVIPGEEFEGRVAGERAREVPHGAIDLRGQNRLRQAGAEALGDFEWGDSIVETFDGSIWKSNLNHEKSFPQAARATMRSASKSPDTCHNHAFRGRMQGEISQKSTFLLNFPA